MFIGIECHLLMSDVTNLNVSGNLAVSMIRKVGLPTYEIQNKDYGYRKFNKKVHIMEQNP